MSAVAHKVNHLSCIFVSYFFTFRIHSYDARTGSAESGRRWSDAKNGFGSRAYFRVRASEADATAEAEAVKSYAMSHLNVESVQRSEAAIYRCRVDFKTAPTRNTLIRLNVIGECVDDDFGCLSKWLKPSLHLHNDRPTRVDTWVGRKGGWNK